MVTTSQLILSGGEGYINFRIGKLQENTIVLSNCLQLSDVLYQPSIYLLFSQFLV